MHWLRRTLIPNTEKNCREKVLFADNVSFQLEKDFHNVCREESGTVVYLLPANNTDIVQPIDAGWSMK